MQRKTNWNLPSFSVISVYGFFLCRLWRRPVRTQDILLSLSMNGASLVPLSLLDSCPYVLLCDSLLWWNRLFILCLQRSWGRRWRQEESARAAFYILDVISTRVCFFSRSSLMWLTRVSSRFSLIRRSEQNVRRDLCVLCWTLHCLSVQGVSSSASLQYTPYTAYTAIHTLSWDAMKKKKNWGFSWCLLRESFPTSQT